MNEQEMRMLLDYWEVIENGQSIEVFHQKLSEAKDSTPSFKDIIKDTKLFFQKQEEMGLDINRVHLHPYGSFFMCYDKNKWMDAREAIVKSSIAIPQYCVDPTVSNHNLDEFVTNFSIDNLPEEFDHPNKPGEVIKVTDKSLTYNFDLTDSVECYMQFFIKCNKVFKTAGMGDTISGTGFIYHQPILEN